MAQVSLERISKFFIPDRRSEPVYAVRDLSMEVGEGEFLVLLGPSGCGKSTTLRLIAGLEAISDGVLKMGGRVVNDVEPKDRDIAMVFQNYALYPHMTVRQNMAFGLELRKIESAEIERRVRSATQLLNLDTLLERFPKELSGGQRQRVAVGRAIVRKPQVFLFDEPLSNLDAQMRTQMRTELTRLHRELKATMIYVTHDQTEAMTMGDRIAVMKGGQLQQLAKPTDLYHSPANLFVAGFIGNPPMNFFRGKTVAKEGALWFEEDRSDAADADDRILFQVSKATSHGLVAGQSVILGIRAEHLGLGPGDVGRVLIHFRGAVELVERLGADTHVHLRRGAHRSILRVPEAAAPELDVACDVWGDADKARWFDAESGRAISN